MSTLAFSLRILPFALLLAGGQALAQESIDHEAEYRACMMLARTDPNAALEAAASWQRVGGGEPARHCVAAANISLGRFSEAARQLEDLVSSMTEPAPSLQSEMMRQAGQAWTLARQDQRALQAQSRGLEIDGSNVELRIDRAITYAVMERYWEAIDDLDKASDLAPDRADIWIYRASAYRQLGELEFAMEHAERAIALDPGNPEALLERGLLNNAMGDPAAAREDWRRIVLMVPGTPAAQIAQQNLEILDGAAQPPAQ